MYCSICNSSIDKTRLNDGNYVHIDHDVPYSKGGSTSVENTSLTHTVRLGGMGTGISEASKRVPIFDRGTGSKPERLRSGSLQADLSLIV